MITKIAFTAALVLLLAWSGVCGENKHSSKCTGKSKRSSIMEQQAYMNWLHQGCPSLIAPRQQPQQQRPLPTWGREGVGSITKGRK